MNRRLPGGGRIDRNAPVGFVFDGKNYSGVVGDTLASALLASGITLVGRSFKYHRPRGVYSAGAEEPNALVTLGEGARREPNIPATTAELRHGLIAASQNRWPSLRFDLRAVNGLFAPLLHAGFYYKTFMGPTKRSWMFYEPFIRRAAGLGQATEKADPDRYETRHEFCEVAVVGAGPAGIAAAIAAGRAGARVTLIEQDFLLGGGLLAEPAGTAGAEWLHAAEGELDALANVNVLRRTTAFGAYDGLTLGLLERRDHERPAPSEGRARQCLIILHPRAIVFATGAIERPLVFANNDRPGVMLASAARTYLNRFGVLAGQRIVIGTNNDGAYRDAFDFAGAGASVTLADLRQAPSALLSRAAREKGVDLRTATAIGNAEGARGVQSASLVEAGGGRALVDCDLVCVSGGWSPTVHLTSHLGARPRWRDDIVGFVPGACAPGSFCAGALMGHSSAGSAAADGAEAGRAAALFCGFGSTGAAFHFPAEDDVSPDASGPIPLPPRSRGKAFVDIQNDVTTADIRLAHKEGYQSVEHLKRYTTQGMGTEQGKTSNVNALALVAELRGVSIPEVGTTTFRPPFTPVAIGALAGRSVGHHFRPVRRTPMHDWHLENGAEMLEVGLWMRPWFYRSAGETSETAYVAEMRFVREAAGIMDISTLGKIDVEGPDAAEFLDRVYVNNWSKLPVGRARYGVMLRDDGIVLDDGTTSRLGEHRYYMTTSTAKAADVMSWLEFLLATAWTNLQVAVTSVTDDWAAMSIAGPRSREILSAAFPQFDLSNAALPHMGAVETKLDGRPIRFLRLSFSGELAYEVHAAASRGRTIWEHLLATGSRFGLRPYGIEALGALRIEKGHVAGPEIDGRTTLADLGLERMASRTKPFIGSVLRHRQAFVEPERPRLVGLECLEPAKRLRPGAILFGINDPVRGHGRGRVTSTTFSPTLGKSIGLALYSGGMTHENEEVVASHPIKDELTRARIVSPVFLDAAGERLLG